MSDLEPFYKTLFCVNEDANIDDLLKYQLKSFSLMEYFDGCVRRPDRAQSAEYLTKLIEKIHTRIGEGEQNLSKLKLDEVKIDVYATLGDLVRQNCLTLKETKAKNKFKKQYYVDPNEYKKLNISLSVLRTKCENYLHKNSEFKHIFETHFVNKRRKVDQSSPEGTYT